MKYTILSALAAVLLFSGCSRDRSVNQLKVFNWTDYIGKNTISSFESKTGAKVTYDNYGSNEDLMAKLETGGAGYDVIFPSAYAVQTLLAKGLLRPLDASLIPNKANVMREFASPDFDRDLKYAIPYTWSTTAIAYDPSFVTEEEARSAAILFDPRMQGKILMLDDMRASLGIALKSMGYSANSANKEEIAQARDKLLAQKKLVHMYASSNLPQTIASGEVKLAYAWSGDILQAIQRNPRLKLSVPSEGALMYVDYVCIPKDSTNPELANRFINHLLDPEVAKDIAETIKYALPNNKVRSLVNKETAQLWEQLNYVSDKNKLEPVKNVGDALRWYDEAWQQIKAK